MRTVFAVASLVTALLTCPVPAEAAVSVPWPVDGGVLLAYGATYGTPVRQCVHRGVDVGCAVGTAVQAPAAAVVAFAGRVPAEDGSTRLAVSLDLPDGLRVTLSPLTDLEVGAGQQVAEGETVGRVAEAGDPSSQEAHLHVGLRRGDAYLDPASLFADTADDNGLVPAMPAVPSAGGEAPPEPSEPAASSAAEQDGAPAREAAPVEPAPAAVVAGIRAEAASARRAAAEDEVESGDVRPASRALSGTQRGATRLNGVAVAGWVTIACGLGVVAAALRRRLGVAGT